MRGLVLSHDAHKKSSTAPPYPTPPHAAYKIRSWQGGGFFLVHPPPQLTSASPPRPLFSASPAAMSPLPASVLCVGFLAVFVPFSVAFTTSSVVTRNIKFSSRCVTNQAAGGLQVAALSSWNNTLLLMDSTVPGFAVAAERENGQPAGQQSGRAPKLQLRSIGSNELSKLNRKSEGRSSESCLGRAR